MKFQKKRGKTKPTIPTASLPDVIFQLILFFMVTTTIKTYDVRVRYILPEAAAVERIDNKKLLSFIWVGKDGRIQLDDNIVKLDDIVDIMYAKRQENPNLIVSLKIDRDSKMGIVIDIQQRLRKADALRINYSALQKL